MTTLITPTPVEGQQLARKLAQELVASHEPEPATMPAMLRNDTPPRPDVSLITAIYFHAISLANAGWRG
jgi:hypothetical protein